MMEKNYWNWKESKGKLWYESDTNPPKNNEYPDISKNEFTTPAKDTIGESFNKKTQYSV